MLRAQENEPKYYLSELNVLLAFRINQVGRDTVPESYFTALGPVASNHDCCTVIISLTKKDRQKYRDCSELYQHNSNYDDGSNEI
jgi:hypothetical protein